VRNELKTDDGQERVDLIDTRALVVASGNQSGLFFLKTPFLNFQLTVESARAGRPRYEPV
jgi:hypothetical protein